MIDDRIEPRNREPLQKTLAALHDHLAGSMLSTKEQGNARQLERRLAFLLKQLQSGKPLDESALRKIVDPEAGLTEIASANGWRSELGDLMARLKRQFPED